MRPNINFEKAPDPHFYVSKPSSSMRGFNKSVWAHFIIIGFIGVLFACKYLPRLSIPWAFAAVCYLATYALQIIMIYHLVLASLAKKKLKWALQLIVVCWVLALLFVYCRIDEARLMVDRWSALEKFWNFLVVGQFPFQAKTHLGHDISGFPGLFMLAGPFYFIGDVGLMQFAGLIGFGVLIWKRFQGSWVFTFLMILLLGLPTFLYEVESRSDLFTNMVVVAWALFLGSKKSLTNGRLLCFWAPTWGVLLATRGVAIIPLVLLSGHFLQSRGVFFALTFGTVLTTVFLATFAPFYIWSPMLFSKHNPFYVQYGNIPSWILVIVLLVSVVFGFKDAHGHKLFLNSGMALFATVLICLGIKAISVGMGNAIFHNMFDISYFSLCLPFLLISLGEYLKLSMPKELMNE